MVLQHSVHALSATPAARSHGWPADAVHEVQSTSGAYGLWRSADVVCHEVAHQWFGNLMTALDWPDLAGMSPTRACPTDCTQLISAPCLQFTCLQRTSAQLPVEVKQPVKGTSKQAGSLLDMLCIQG